MKALRWSRPFPAARTLAAAVVTTVLSALILVHYHDRFWLPRDDGYYAHVAERVLDGEVLHRDIHAFHPGYVYFAGALAMRLFGRDFLSLRYPLVLLGLLQSLLIFALLRPRGAWLACAGATAATCLSFVQLPDPTPNWYCLFLFFALAWVLAQPASKPGRRDLVLGFILGLIALLRQPTGVFLGIGVLAFRLGENPAGEGGSGPSKEAPPRLARALLVLAFGALALYSASKPEPLALLLIALPPLALVMAAVVHTEHADRPTASLLLRLASGALVAAAPLVIYHLATHSLADWYHDAVVDALALAHAAYQQVPGYSMLIAGACSALVRPGPHTAPANALLLPLLVLAPGILGASVVWQRLRRRAQTPPQALHPLPFLAVFYSLVAMLLQQKTYLFYVAAPVVSGLLWLGASSRRKRRWAAASTLVFGAWALYYHAAQPLTRSFDQVIDGVRRPVVPATGIARASLWIDPRERDMYQQILAVIARDSAPQEAILALPANADLFFLSGRHNPLPYAYVSFAIRDRETLTTVRRKLAADPPALVFYVPSLPYNTSWSEQLMDDYRRSYERLDDIGFFEIYRRIKNRHAAARSPHRAVARCAVAHAGTLLPPAGAGPGRAVPRAAGGA